MLGSPIFNFSFLTFHFHRSFPQWWARTLAQYIKKLKSFGLNRINAYLCTALLRHRYNKTVRGRPSPYILTD